MLTLLAFIALICVFYFILKTKRDVCTLINTVKDKEKGRQRQIIKTKYFLAHPNISAIARAMLEKKLVELEAAAPVEAMSPARQKATVATTASDDKLWDENPFNV